MSNEEAAIAWTDVESKLVSESVAKKFIKELGRKLVSVE
jgi:hypothetical protein